jgi:acyl-CoA thioester hydrolase
MPRLDLDVDSIRGLPETNRKTIPESYLDAMGHMNVMWYTHLFSDAMGGVFKMIGLHWDQLDGSHVGTFALEAHIRYLAEVRVGQTISVRSRVVGRSERRFYFMHFMVNEDRDNVAATFENIGTFVDLRIRRTAPIPEDISNNLNTLFSEHDALSWKAPVCGVMKP